MFDKQFAKWWLNRILPYTDVPAEKLAAEQDAAAKQQEFNQNYQDFMKTAVFPVIEDLLKMLDENHITHRATTWGNQLAVRVHLAWRWGELNITQSHEDAISFEHHIITEGEKRGDDSTEDHTHQYDLRDPLPQTIAVQEVQFFLSRLAQDIFEVDIGPEIPPEKL